MFTSIEFYMGFKMRVDSVKFMRFCDITLLLFCAHYVCARMTLPGIQGITMDIQDIKRWLFTGPDINLFGRNLFHLRTKNHNASFSTTEIKALTEAH